MVFFGGAFCRGPLLAHWHVDDDQRALWCAVADMAIHQHATVAIDVSVGRRGKSVLRDLAALPSRLLLLGTVRVFALASTGVAQRAAGALEGSLGGKHGDRGCRNGLRDGAHAGWVVAPRGCRLWCLAASEEEWPYVFVEASQQGSAFLGAELMVKAPGGTTSLHDLTASLESPPESFLENSSFTIHTVAKSSNNGANSAQNGSHLDHAAYEPTN